MPELTREVFVDLWRAVKAGEKSPDKGLVRIQKFMSLHDDMHPYFDRIAADPDTPLEVEGDNLLVHIAMDAATEVALEADDPSGVRSLMQTLLDATLETSQAFHVLSQAMAHEFLVAAKKKEQISKQGFLARATSYAEQAKAQHLEQRQAKQNG